MSLGHVLLPALLMQSVLRQVRGRRLSAVQLAWPLAIVGWAAMKFVRGVPASTGNIALIVSCAASGAVLGGLAGACTRVRTRDGDGAVIAYATAATVALWTLGTVARLLFEVYAEHGGGSTVVAFSAAHALSLRAWGTALTLMALAEVVGRTAVLGPRAICASRRSCIGAGASSSA